MVSGCTSHVDQARESDSLLQTDREWAAAAAAGDIARLTTFWAEDATNFFPGAPVAHGKEAIRELVKRNRSQPGFSVTWNPTRAVVSESGDLGYTFGAFELAASDSSGNLVQRDGHYVAIWRKQTDGTWKCEVESSIFTK
jgi:ketosteroid isomerase-like protein